jgi:nitrous oxide reductase accessory protein NosL
LACAARGINENRERVREIEVASFLTGEPIDARTAVYLEGSDVPGVMSHTSRIAFPTREEARTFRKKHGGKIVSFDEAVRNQLRDQE